MRRTSARFRLGGVVAVVAAAATVGGLTAWNGNASEPAAAETLAVGTPEGYGAATTGGAGGDVVQVSSASEFEELVNSDGALQIEVTGTIQLDDMVRVGSDKTIVGSGTSGVISGGGLNIRQVDNVIVQNLTFTGAGDDAINVDESTNVWIDHNDISNASDGATDIKHGADNVTVSWNHYHDQDKNSLVGHSDDNASEDSGRLHVSYHHNWFDGTGQRNPRVRFGNPVHVYNNYYLNVGNADVGSGEGYGVASTQDAGVLVEGNFFEDTIDPFHLGEGSSSEGSLVARDNEFVNSGEGQQGGSVSDPSYAYTLDPAADIPGIVTAGAGVGNL
ncbi:right-handed parallel beta-helix repeat-containing protein [Streptomyces sp. B6B3]|uniref:pectate lyase family protein n=1 Tax=Streptomyces sp. B6B3 TaxID=3153570 RepID=UPI00325CF91C